MNSMHIYMYQQYITRLASNTLYVCVVFLVQMIGHEERLVRLMCMNDWA